MNAWWLTAAWAVLGIGACVVLPRLRRRRATALAPLIAAWLGTLAATSGGWPGPLASTSGAGSLTLAREGMGLLLVAGTSAGLTLVLSPSIDGVEALTVGLVGAAAVVMLGSTVPVLWAGAVAVAVAVVAMRWITAAPGRPTLAAARIVALGAAALAAAATLLPAASAGSVSRATVAGILLAAGVCALLAVVPLGGWATAAGGALRGGDLAPWLLVLAPAVLLSAAAIVPSLTQDARTPFADALLGLGLSSAIFGGVQACRAGAPTRFRRLMVADLALAAAGIGTLQAPGRLGALLIVLTELAAAPLLLHVPRLGLERPHRISWLAVSGLPPAPAFWGRLLVLEALATTGGVALAAGLAASAALLATAARGLIAEGEPPGEGVPAGRPLRLLGWAVCLSALALGFAPAAIAGQVFGLDFGGS